MNYVDEDSLPLIVLLPAREKEDEVSQVHSACHNVIAQEFSWYAFGDEYCKWVSHVCISNDKANFIILLPTNLICKLTFLSSVCRAGATINCMESVQNILGWFFNSSLFSFQVVDSTKLWGVTWTRIDQFLPGFLKNLFLTSPPPPSSPPEYLSSVVSKMVSPLSGVSPAPPLSVKTFPSYG